MEANANNNNMNMSRINTSLFNNSVKHMTPLERVIYRSNGDVTPVQEHLQNNPSDLNNYYGLVLAARHGHDTIVTYLLDNGMSVNVPEGYHRNAISAIEAAVKSHNISTIQLLQERGASTNEAFNVAAYNKMRDVIDLLVENGGHIGHSSAIAYAARFNDVEFIRYLLELGADPDARTGRKSQKTALHITKNIEIAQLLVNAGADINAEDYHEYTPLHYAIRNIEYARWLLDHGADMYAQTLYERYTPYDYAVEEGVDEAIALFEEYGYVNQEYEHAMLENYENNAMNMPAGNLPIDAPARCFDPVAFNEDVNVSNTPSTVFYIKNQNNRITKAICIDDGYLNAIAEDENKLFYRVLDGRKQWIRRLDLDASYYISDNQYNMVMSGNKYIISPSGDLGQLYNEYDIARPTNANTKFYAIYRVEPVVTGGRRYRKRTRASKKRTGKRRMTRGRRGVRK